MPHWTREDLENLLDSMEVTLGNPTADLKAALIHAHNELTRILEEDQNDG